MSNARKLAERIPAEYRKEILEMNLIHEAQAINTNPMMIHLITIYQNYIDSSFKPDCNLCCTSCLNAFKLMLPILIELEKQSNVLDNV